MALLLEFFRHIMCTLYYIYNEFTVRNGFIAAKSVSNVPTLLFLYSIKIRRSVSKCKNDVSKRNKRNSTGQSREKICVEYSPLLESITINFKSYTLLFSFISMLSHGWFKCLWTRIKTSNVNCSRLRKKKSFGLCIHIRWIGESGHFKKHFKRWAMRFLLHIGWH